MNLNRHIFLISLLCTLCVFCQNSFAGTILKTKPEHQQIGITITNLYDINVQNSSFKIIAWINIKHRHLTPNPIDQIEFINGIGQKKTFSSTTKTTDGQYLSSAKFFVTVSQHFDLARFPLDDHTLIINIENSDNGVKKLVYTLHQPMLKNTSILAPQAIEKGWFFKKVSVEVGETQYRNRLTPQEEDMIWYSQVLIKIHLERSSMRSFFFVFTTLYLSFFLFWFALALPITKQFEYNKVRNSLTISSVVALTGNFLITQNLLQHTYHFSSIDQLQLLTLFLCIFILVINSTHLTQFISDPFVLKSKNRMRIIISISTMLIYVIGNVLILML